MRPSHHDEAIHHTTGLNFTAYEAPMLPAQRAAAAAAAAPQGAAPPLAGGGFGIQRKSIIQITKVYIYNGGVERGWVAAVRYRRCPAILERDGSGSNQSMISERKNGTLVLITSAALKQRNFFQFWESKHAPPQICTAFCKLTITVL